jgi:hypothetical protein
MGVVIFLSCERVHLRARIPEDELETHTPNGRDMGLKPISRLLIVQTLLY